MQRFKMFYWLILGFVVNTVQANQYQAAMDQSRWLVTSHLLSCRMIQEIPGSGVRILNSRQVNRYSFTDQSPACHVRGKGITAIVSTGLESYY